MIMDEKVKILLCEDDENLGTLLCEYLIAKGYDAVLCPDGEVGYREFTKEKFDICILDVMMPCEVCHGKRYNRETLEVRFKGKSIADVLDMTVNMAVEFFENVPTT